MYQQIVYTRCKPRRELLNTTTGIVSDGRVVNEEGFAIHNFSKGILDKNYLEDPLLLEAIIKKKNAAKESGSNSTGVFLSYEYFCISTEKSCIGQEYLRPYDANDVRANGQRHRPGNYIKQYIVGKIDTYPCLLFGADIWDAYNKTENYYYHDNNEPLEYLPEIEQIFSNGYIVRERVKTFINEGRAECVKKILQFILTEMSKSAKDRKFIVIKDYPENVELWVAAIELSLPIYLANKISFSTNVAASNNLSVDNTYYCDSNNRYVKELQRAEKERKNYFSMIVGIHPTARGSAGIVQGMNNADFILVDGANNSIDYSGNNDINKNYFEAATKMDKDIEDFCNLLAELKNIEFGANIGDLYELFDGYKYLLDISASPEFWEYSLIQRYLNIFQKYEIRPYKWSIYLAKKVCAVYDKYYEVDFKNGFPLLKLILNMDYSEETNKHLKKFLLQKYLNEIKPNFIDTEKASRLYKQNCTIYMDMPKLVAEQYIKNVNALIRISENWSAKESIYIFKMFCDANSIHGVNTPNWYKENENLALLIKLAEKIYTDNQYSLDMLNHITNMPLYLELTKWGLNYDISAIYRWLELVAKSVSDSKVDLICGICLENENISFQQYERFLSILLQDGKPTTSLFRYLIMAIEKYGVDEQAGYAFLVSFLEVHGRHIDEIIKLMDLLLNSDLCQQAIEYSYEKINDYICDLPVDTKLCELAKKFEVWRNSIYKPASRAYVIVMANDFSGLSNNGLTKVLEKYTQAESISVDENDIKLLLSKIDRNIENNEVFVKLYHIIGNSEKAVKDSLFKDVFLDMSATARYMRIFLDSNKSEWAEVFSKDIALIEEEFYTLIKSENIDKLEKSIKRYLGKNSPEIRKFEKYFKDLKNKIKAERIIEKEKINAMKKKPALHTVETSEEKEKKGFFSKIFIKK